MECEKIRDWFSSLLEGELNPSEEKVIREHLSSCSECQKDYERFDKTIRWLHSVGEVEVPEGFISGIYKKREDQKSKTIISEKVRSRWFSNLTSFKIPIQAVAMITVVFLVLYITKMMPIETPQLKDARQTKVPLSEKRIPEPSLEASRLKEVEQTQSPVPIEKKSEETLIPKVSPSPSLSEPGKIEKGLMAKGSSPLILRSPKEIVLRIYDREKTLSQLDALVMQFGGEIVRTEGNILLASLPVASFSEFEKELLGLSSPVKEDRMNPEKGAMKSLSVTAGVKKREVQGKDKDSGGTAADSESHIVIRIILLQE